MDKGLRILHLEVNTTDAERLHAQISENFNVSEIFWVIDFEDFCSEFLSGKYNLILSDINVPGMADVHAPVKFVRKHDSHVPFIYVSGTIGEEGAVDTLRHGATDFVLKCNIEKLLISIDRGIKQAVIQRASLQGEIEKNNAIELQASVMDNLSAHIAVLDKDGVIRSTNKAWKTFAIENELTNLDRVDVGTNYFDVLDSSDKFQNAIKEGILSVINGERQYYYVDYPCHSPNKERWYTLRVTPLCHLEGCIVSHTNISIRVQAEREIQQQSNKLNNIIKGTNLGTWEWNFTTKELGINERYAEILGYELPELLPFSVLKWKSFIHPEDLTTSKLALQEHLDGKKEFYQCEIRLKHSSGTWVWVFNRGQVLERNHLNEPLRMFGTHLEITNRKLAEDQIRFSEEKYRNLFEKMGEGLLLMDEFGTILMTNAKFVEMTGFSRDELVGSNGHFLMPSKLDIDQIIERLELRKKGISGRYETTLLRKNGDKIWVAVSASPQNDSNGNYCGVLSIIADITVQKNQEDFKRIVFNLSNKISSENINLKGLCLYVQNELSAILDTSNFYIALALNDDCVDFIYFKDQLSTEEDSFQRKNGNGLTEYILKSGNPLLLCGNALRDFIEKNDLQNLGVQAKSWLGAPLKNKGKTTGVIVCQSYTQEDVFTSFQLTLLTQLGQQLGSYLDQLRTEEEKNRIYNLTNDLICIVDSSLNFRFLNPSFSATLGFAPEEFYNHTLADFFLPEDYTRMLDLLLALKKKKAFENIVNRCIHQNGSIVWISWNVNRDKNEGLYYLVGRNITEEKQIQDRITASEKQYRELFEKMAEGLMFSSPDGTILMVNPGLCNLLGYSSNDLIGKNGYTFLHNPRVAKELKAKVKERKSGKSDQYETEFLKKNGEPIKVQLNASPNIGTDGKIAGIMSIILDITAKSKSETQTQRIILLQENLNKLNEAVIVNANFDSILTIFNEALSAYFKTKTHRIYLHNTETSALTIYKQEIENSLAKGIEKLIGRNIKSVVPSITSDTFFRSVIENQELVLLNDRDSIIKAVKDHSESVVLKGFASSVVDLLKMKVYAIFPLVFEGKVIGLIDKHSQEQLSTDEIEDIRIITSQANIVLDRFFSEQKTVNSETRFRSFTEKAPNAIMVIDQVGIIQYFNQRILELPEGVTVGSSVYDIIKNNEYKELFKNRIERVIYSQNHENFELRTNDSKGSEKWIRVNAGIVDENDPDTREIILIIDEITDEKTLELERENYSKTQVVLNKILELSTTHASVESLLNAALLEVLELPFIDSNKRGVIFLCKGDSKLTAVAHNNMASIIQNRCSEIAFGDCLCGKVAAEGKIIHKATLDPEHTGAYHKMEEHGHYVLPINSGNGLEGVLNLYLDQNHPSKDNEIFSLKAIASTLGTIIEKKRAERRLLESEQSLKEAQRISQIGSWEYYQQADELSWSEQVFHIFDQDPQKFKVTYANFLDLVHPEDRKTVDLAMKKSLKPNKHTHLEHRIELADGTIRYLQYEIRATMDNSEALRAHGTVQNITDLKNSFAIIEESERKFRDLFENVADAIFTLNSEGKITSYNKALIELLTNDTTELRGISFTNLFVPTDRDRFKTHYQEIISGISREKFVGQIMDKDGNILWIETSISPILDQQEQFNGSRVIARNITERKRLEDNLNVIAEISSTHGGDSYFIEISNLLCNLLNVKCALVGVFNDDISELKTLGLSLSGEQRLRRTFSVKETIIEDILLEQQTIKRNYPASCSIHITDEIPALRNYVGISLWKDDSPLGIILIADDVAILPADFYLSLLRGIEKRTITEIQRVKTQEIVINNERRFRALIEKSSELTVIVDTSGIVKFISPSVRQIMGYETTEVEGKNAFDFVHESDKETAFLGLIERAADGGEGNYNIYRFRTKDNEFKYLRVMTANHLETPGINGLIINAQDIDELVEAEREKTITIMRTEESERKRISRDLHDGLGQSIAAANMYFNTLESLAKAQLDPKAFEIYKTGKKLINNAAKETRVVSHNIMPPSLKQFGFRKTIEELISDYDSLNSEQKFILRIETEDFNLPEESSLALYRCIQELLNNAIKYSNAKTIATELLQSKDILHIKITDDGVGFNVTEKLLSSINRDSIGLASVQQRISAINGEVRFTSSEAGTAIFLKIPLPKNA